MTRVIAAIDGGSLTPAVCMTASTFAHTFGADAEVLHVRDDGAEGRPAPHAHGLPVHLAEGHAIDAILAASRAADVLAVVLGARGRRHAALPVGHTVLGVLLGTTKSVVVVPPRATAPEGRIRRIFVPLEDDPGSAGAVENVVRTFRERSTEVVVVHVFDDVDPLRFADRPSRDASLWGAEFLLRSRQPAAGLRLTRGAASVGVAEVTQSDGADLLVVSWSRNFDPGRAAVVRRLLDDAPVPVLLVPVDGDLRP